MGQGPIRVMVVDDSAVVRQVLGAMVSSEPGLELIGAHSDPLFAQKAMAQNWPDVLILDVEMPRMDGVTFLRQIMSTRPTPVVICSTLTTANASTTLEAMQAGAFEIIEKPNASVRDQLQAQRQRLISAVKSAARANVHALARKVTPTSVVPLPMGLEADKAKPVRAMSETTDRIVAVGTSTGGTQALEFLLSRLPVTAPGMVIVQHMPEAYTLAFAERLNQVCQVRVKQAQDGERIISGQALIAPGGRHLQVRRQGAYYYAVVKDGPPVSRHRPSVNVLFASVAHHAGPNAVGIIMTGMGDDGARGMLEMKQAGATTYAQDEASCVVFGMPREAIKLHAVDQILPLDELHDALMGRISAKGRRTAAAQPA
ncbi:MAG: chemotaxis response regulator protein-glutamate methylesterase [Aquabacterium sp.]|uniref:protein-glutamate methylesterase/protein-glutamine glutaminase n=1 Tax=Aquabacterium sp. TaxID=1872578 RepID=UPI0025BACDF4|nr:chemotaxis response regulator protein-glutamate methylesterase [Aquabacterium sp.]MBI5924086.1 chemotaxis response regulator protein-glutamate methylesterase [Aquabacterium sp.]